MKNSRRGRIIELLSQGLPDDKIISIIDKEYPVGMFSTTNANALAGTKWDLGKKSVRTSRQPLKQKEYDPLYKTKLIEALRKFEPQPVIDAYIQKDRLTEKSPSEILIFSFGNSIYRGIHNERPKERYLKWRWHNEPNKLVDSLNALHNQKQFDQFALAIGYSIVDEWGHKNNLGEPTKMNIGLAMKITNLVFKHLYFLSNVKTKN